MSQGFHSGLHPDADLLNAFMEGVLPEHERVECLTHLAECAECREVVSLLGHAAAVTEPAVAVAVEKTSFWKRLLRPMTVMAMVVAAVFVTFTVGLYRMIRSAEKAPQVTASVQAPAQVAPPVAQSAPEPVAKVPVPARAAPKKQAEVTEQQPQPPAFATAPPPSAPGTVQVPRAAAPLMANARMLAPSGAVAVGTVTDRAGAVVLNATVELTNENTQTKVDAGTSGTGSFTVAGLAPGTYDLSVTAPGFKKFFRAGVVMQARETIRVDSTLDVGTDADTVTVTAEASLLKTESGEVSHQGGVQADSLPAFAPSRAVPLPLPGYKLPDGSEPVSFAVKGRTVVAADASGALFVSGDEGKGWAGIRGEWKGRVMRVASTKGGTFQLVTDPASTWVSTDGRQWVKVR